MEQKDYKLEIVKVLLHGKSHIRGIANTLGTNHMIISRKMKELARNNIVDFLQEGKNKSFFLKKTAESRAITIMAENYNIIMAISKYPNLRVAVEKIQKNKDITLAIIFGSYAKGLATNKSDVDIYISTNNREIKKELQLIDSKLSIKIGQIDAEIPLAKEIEKNHIIVKGVEEYYEKNKLF
ncbi:MAG: nucleotidyltransferase domain-containing protein [archaeon]